MDLLVPVRYPLGAHSRRTLTRAIDLAAEADDAHLYVLHVNLVHEGGDVDRAALREAVEREFGPLDDATYHVRDAFLLESAVLQEAIQQDVDCIVIGRDARARWIQRLEYLLDIDVDLEKFLREHLDIRLEVVG